MRTSGSNGVHIFVSAVTNEFGKARDAVAADLRARGHCVKVQSDFRQSPDSESLLGTLAEYVRDCHAVVCVVGNRSGACPPPRAAARTIELLRGVQPEDIKEASYTQWEFLLARHFKRRLYVYLADKEYVPDCDAPEGDRTALQDAYLALLKAEGVHHSTFRTAEELQIAVLRDEPEIAAELPPRRLPPAKPIVLPYPSIGPLFKGRQAFMRQLHESLARNESIAITSKAPYGL